MIGRRYALSVYAHREEKGRESMRKRVSKGGARLTVVRVIVFMIVCIVRSI